MNNNEWKGEESGPKELIKVWPWIFGIMIFYGALGFFAASIDPQISLPNSELAFGLGLFFCCLPELRIILGFDKYSKKVSFYPSDLLSVLGAVAGLFFTWNSLASS